MRKITIPIFVMFFSITVPALAQHEHMNHMDMKSSSTKQNMSDDKESMSDDKEGMMDHDMSSMSHGQHGMDMEGMKALYGNYPMTREASGTSWQPDSTPHGGIHFMKDDWMMMVHGFANVIYDKQGGDRGDEKTFSESMFMFMAQHPAGSGTFGFRSMLSLDPLMGRDGYPLLLQTGETQDGLSPLIDRQHPHDLFMELAVTYSQPINEDSSVFGYVGLPGEPALGPPAFMHRFSGIDNPEAPILHHWLDATHITYGVTTLGYVWKNFKVEGSAFRGREPDESRWDIEAPELDSYSGRLTYNPTADWSFQVSYGDIDSPEQLHPEVDVKRYTASATYNKPLEIGNWQTTLAWGKNNSNPGANLDGILLESALQVHKMHTFFGRFEYAQKNELFEDNDPRAEDVFNVEKTTVGYIYDFPEWNKMQWGLGGSYSWHFLPSDLDSVYGENPQSFMLFARVKL